ncbi:MAG: polymer-forming cytoskeletal protein [Pseudomonadota bacterium]
MFTKKPEPSKPMAKLGGDRPSPAPESKSSPFTERPSPQPKAPGPAMGKMIPSIIGEDLTIEGNVSSKGEIQVDGRIKGDVHCGSLLLGDKAQVDGSVIAEDVVIRGKVMGSIRGLRVSLQSQSHVEGDIHHQSLAIEQGAYFEGKSRRSDNPLATESSGSGHSAPAPSSGNPFSSNAAE